MPAAIKPIIPIEKQINKNIFKPLWVITSLLFFFSFLLLLFFLDINFKIPAKTKTPSKIKAVFLNPRARVPTIKIATTSINVKI